MSHNLFWAGSAVFFFYADQPIREPQANAKLQKKKKNPYHLGAFVRALVDYGEMKSRL